jgi:1,4-dihydroxy-2-naphthoyl-CoA hydrolase
MHSSMVSCMTQLTDVLPGVVIDRSRPRHQPITEGAPSLDAIEGTSAFVVAAGLQLDEVGPRRVVGHIDLGPEHHQPHGIVHGGVYLSAVETAASVGATAAVIPKGQVAVGVHNSTNFLASMTEGRVVVVAEPIVQGRTQQLWNVEITRESDARPIATGQLRVQNVEPRR